MSNYSQWSVFGHANLDEKSRFGHPGNLLTETDIFTIILMIFEISKACMMVTILSILFDKLV